MMTDEDKKYDGKGRVIYERSGPEQFWISYDDENEVVYVKKLILKTIPFYYKWEAQKTPVILLHEEYEEKEFLSREEIPRFDLMEL